MLSRRGVCAGALALTTMLLATGCQSDTEGAADVAESFVEALYDGRFADALDLTTASPNDFVCDWMTSNSPGAGGVDARPLIEIDDIDERDGAAQVEARLLGDPVTPITLNVVRSAAQWRVEIPSDWSLEVSFDSPTVYQASLGDCILDADGWTTTSTLTWPVLHPLSVEDPTGVLFQQMTTRPVSVPEQNSVSLTGVPEESTQYMRVNVRSILWDEWLTCARSGVSGTLDSPSCPPELQGQPTLLTTLDEPTSNLGPERLWTEDGQLWSFETGEVTAVLELESGEESRVPFRYRGTIDTTTRGAAVLTLDE